MPFGIGKKKAPPPPVQEEKATEPAPAPKSAPAKQPSSWEMAAADKPPPKAPFHALVDEAAPKQDDAWFANQTPPPTELRLIADDIAPALGFFACGNTIGDIDMELIESAIKETDRVRGECVEAGGSPAAIDTLDREFQQKRLKLLKMPSSDPDRAIAARAEIVAGIALINAILTAAVAAWLADPAKLEQFPPEEAAGYITLAWSQIHWGLLKAPAYIRQNTAEVLRQRFNSRVASFLPSEPA